MNFSRHHWVRLYAATLLLLFLSFSGAVDASETIRKESVKQQSAREKALLLASAGDLSRTLAYTSETVGLLNEGIEAAVNHEHANKVRDGQGLLEWYQKYADWLTGMSAEFDHAMGDHFSRQQSSAGWTTRYEALAKGFRKLADELGGIVRKLENQKNTLEVRMQKLNKAVAERRILVDKDDLELVRELWPAYRDKAYDRREALYKDLTDEEVIYFRSELRSLVEQQKYFEGLSELGRYEEIWLIIKADEFTKLNEIVRVIGGDEPGPVVYVIRDTIRTYEADRTALNRRSGEIDAKNRGITRTGSLRTLDRLEELSRYYDNMKNRFDRHSEWLGAQIGSYQADLIVLGKEL